MKNMKHYENLPLKEAWTKYEAERDSGAIGDSVDFTEWLVDHDYIAPKVDVTYGNPREKDDGTTYTLPELAEKVHIDSWVEGISAMCAMDEIRKEVYDMAGMVEDEDNPICPAEFETEYTKLAEKYKFRFNRKGQIVSFNLKADKED